MLYAFFCQVLPYNLKFNQTRSLLKMPNFNQTELLTKYYHFLLFCNFVIKRTFCDVRRRDIQKAIYENIFSS